MLDSRWSIFRSYLFSVRVLASGSISLLLGAGLIQAKPSLANSLHQQEPTPEATSPNPVPATQRQADAERKEKKKIRGKNVTAQVRSGVAMAAPLNAPKSLSAAEVDLAQPLELKNTDLEIRATPERSATSSAPERSPSAQSTSIPTNTVGISPTVPIQTADNYWQMNGTGLGVPGQYGPGMCGGNCNGWPQPLGQGSNLPTLSAAEQPLPVPTPLPTVRSEASSSNFSPQQLPWMSGVPVPAPGWGVANGNAYPYPYAVGQLPPVQASPMPPGGWNPYGSPYGWNPNGGFYPMGQPLPAPMPAPMVSGGVSNPSNSSNNVYFYNRFAPSPSPNSAPVAAPSMPNLSAPPVEQNFYQGAPTYPSNFYQGAPNYPSNFSNGAPNYPNNFYNQNPGYPTNFSSPIPPGYPGNIYNQNPGYPGNFPGPTVGYPATAYPNNSYPPVPGYPSNFYPNSPGYPGNFPGPMVGYPATPYPASPYPPAPGYPSNFSGPPPAYPGSFYNAAPNYPGNPAPSRPYPSAPYGPSGAPSPYGSGYPSGQPTAFPPFQNTPTPTAPQSTTVPPSNLTPAAALETRPETSSMPLLRSTALSEPSVQLQGVYLYQGNDSSARARLSAAYPLTPNILFGGALDLTTGQGLADSQQEGLSLNELFVATSPRDLPNLRFVVGQLDLTSYFDRNSFAKDGASHFFNPVFQTNSALTATGIGSRPGALVNWSLTDNIEARFAAFSSARSIGDFSLDGFAGELGLRYGNAIIRATYTTGRETGAGDGFREIFQVNRGDGITGPQRGDREEGFGINAEVFIPSLNMGLFGRYGEYNNRGIGEQGNTYNVGVTALDVFAPDDRLGLAYGRQLSNAALRREQGDRNPDVLELYYDFRFLPNLRLGFTLQELNGFSETIAGFRLKTEFDVTPKGRLQ
uniref:hypothetical protein n=1 Tax=Trichocoleus desertorum TaxID=1481672 RepID=UPI0025B35700|nr:hypothetical protein [Trichocoleus desertorum]